MPTDLMPLSSVALSCTVALGVRKVLLTYDGAYDSLQVPSELLEDGDARPRSGISKYKHLTIPGFRLMESYANRTGAVWTSFQKARDQLSNRVWDFNACLAEAMQYTKRTDFDKYSSGAYRAARMNGWIEEVCSHMQAVQERWTKDRCAEEAKKYSSRQEFNKKCNGAYHAAHRNGWLDEICPYNNPQIRWTLTMAKKEAHEYRTRTEFKRLNPRAYAAAKRNGWLDELF
jgi:hypothetical protein